MKRVFHPKRLALLPLIIFPYFLGMLFNNLIIKQELHINSWDSIGLYLLGLLGLCGLGIVIIVGKLLRDWIWSKE